MAETHDEEVEALKKWWSENGRAIILGVAIGGASILGWRYWQAHQISYAEDASTAYYQVLRSHEQNDVDATRANATIVRDEFADTPYASLTALLQARIAVEEGDLEGAAAELRWAMDNSSEDDVRIIARLRLARVLTDQESLDEALDLLSNSVPAAYRSLHEEIRGDIYLARGESREALEAYELALSAGPQAGGSTVLQMKIDDLASLKD
ncbi:MAG: tetratricopeptide repeat protein [Pseudomonadota bacterium]